MKIKYIFIILAITALSCKKECISCTEYTETLSNGKTEVKVDAIYECGANEPGRTQLSQKGSSSTIGGVTTKTTETRYKMCQ